MNLPVALTGRFLLIIVRFTDNFNRDFITMACPKCRL